MDHAAHDSFLGELRRPGRFTRMVMGLLDTMVPFEIAITGCAIALSNRVVEFTDGCAGRLGEANALHLLANAAAFSVLLHVSLTTGTWFIIRNKRTIDELPAAISWWCRRAIFAVVIFQTITFLCVIRFSDVTLHCLGVWKWHNIAGEAARLAILAFCLMCSTLPCTGIRVERLVS